MADHEHILIVDDDTQVPGLFMRTLTREGFIVTGTTSGADAIEFALATSPEVIVMDMAMPEVDGFEILKVLHTQVRGLRGDRSFRQPAGHPSEQ